MILGRRWKPLTLGAICSGLFLCTLAGHAQDTAPPSPNKPWNPPPLPVAERELALRTKRYSIDPVVGINPDHVYDLGELIDLAECNNPQTRTAWERARAAAAAVGLSKSSYYPVLAATAATTYVRMFDPFPKLEVNKQALNSALQGLAGNLANGGTSTGTGTSASSGNGTGALVSVTGGDTLVTRNWDSEASLNVQWLLFDFGGREAQVAQARAQLLGANMSFNATHQQIVYQVTQLFYSYNASRQKLVAATTSRRAAATVLKATETRLAVGLAKLSDELRAEQQDAQAEFDLVTSRANLVDAQALLINALGVPPTASLRVAEMPGLRPSNQIEPSLDALVDRALSHRPELVALLANIKAARAGVRRVRAEYFPTFSVSGTAAYANLDNSAGGGPYLDAHDYAYKGLFSINWLLFDGFARDNQMRIARAQLASAESQLAQARDETVREVWQSYTDFKSSFVRRDASARSLTAAEAAFDVTLRYYQQGLATYPEVVDAEKAAAAARSLDVDVRAEVFTRAAALARSVGDIERPVPPARTPLPPKLPRPTPTPTKSTRPVRSPGK